jgi:hypothetical protein
MRRSLVILVTGCLSTTAFAQGSAGNKPVARSSRKSRQPANSSEPSEARSWAGDCVGAELLKGTHTSPEQGPSVIPPGQKE